MFENEFIMNAIIDKRNLGNSQDRAYQFLKNGILNLDFQPNQRLRAQEIASSLDISRTPVREALSRLEQEALVRRDSGWGYVVGAMSFKEAMDIYKVREALEVEAAKEAITKIDDSALRELETILCRSEKARQSRLKEFRANTRAFHQSIVKVADNACLQFMLLVIADRVWLLGAMIFDKHSDRVTEVIRENRKIFEALKAKDLSATEAAVRNHVQRSKENLIQFVIRDEGKWKL